MMMFDNNLHLSGFLIFFFFYLVFVEATKLSVNQTMIYSSSTNNMTLHEKMTSLGTTRKTIFIQGQEFIHNRFNKMNRNTFIWSTVAFASITALLSIYIAIKTFM